MDDLECECGHMEDEHDEMGECLVEDCDCILFDYVGD